MTSTTHLETLVETLRPRFQAVHERIEAAARAHGREAAAITLIAVGKTKPVALLRAAAELGQRNFGENYSQELVDKRTALAAAPIRPPVQWHFIGPIQSNKTTLLAEACDWLHSLDRDKIAARLNAARDRRSPLPVLIQVNLDAEASKAGVAPYAVRAFAERLRQYSALQLRGLMAIPAPRVEPGKQRQAFARLRQLAEGLAREGHTMDTLSMGMSADLEAAIAEGATHVRIGSALFGARTPRG